MTKTDNFNNELKGNLLVHKYLALKDRCRYSPRKLSLSDRPILMEKDTRIFTITDISLSALKGVHLNSHPNLDSGVIES